jgi:hypothetical protein
MRKALREHLERLRVLQMEMADREGYLRFPEDRSEGALWDEVVTWPDKW